MSLQVWLPLDGNLKNLGVSKNNFIFSHLVGFTDNGKTGKCLTSNIVSSNTSLPTILMSNTKYSMCSWINTNLGGKWIWYMGGGTGTSRGLWIESNGTISFAYNGSEAFISDISVNDNAWHHICLTCDGTNGKMYIDGVYHKGSNSIRVDNAGANDIRLYGANCSLCDFRIYDHCLSAQEVKKISQGLVIHYPLNNNGLGKENLITCVSCARNNPQSTENGGRTQYLNHYGIIIPASENADTYFSLWTSLLLQENKKYTLSCYCSGLISGTQYNFPLYQQGNTSMGIFRIKKNGLNTFTFIKNYNGSVSTSTFNGFTVYQIFLDDSSRRIVTGQGPITLSSFKLEENDTATDFNFNSKSKEYTQFQLSDNIEKDISGFGNNGIRNNITYNYLTKVKYGKSAMFNGTNSYIKCNTNNWMVQGAETISYSFWACEDSWNNSGTRQLLSCTQAGGFSFVFSNSVISFYLHVYTNANKTSTDYPSVLRNLTHNLSYGWHHFVFTYKKQSYAKIYIDGILFKSVDLGSSYGVHYNTSARLFLGCQANTDSPISPYFNGKMSDFRFYVTQLSEEDVKDLYNYNKPEYYLEEESQDVEESLA